MPLLRCSVAVFLLTGCVSTPDLVKFADDGAGASTDESAVEGPDTVQARQAEQAREISHVVVESETFTYSMTLKRENRGDPRIMCSHGKRTGSHFQQKYCRTEEVSQQEREAAREFFEDARRRGN